MAMKCPRCGRRVFDAENNKQTKLKSGYVSAAVDFYIKCYHCGAIIAVSKTA
jgi:hypothetical protein